MAPGCQCSRALSARQRPAWSWGNASAPGAQLPGGAAHTPGAAPRTGLLRNEGLLGHLADHVVEDAPIVEISELHVGVKPHDSLEGLPSI